jgi:two-component system chemotaxis response regulator CheY
MNAKVLIVDDSSLARRTLRQLLEEMGYTVEEATDGVQALERYYIGGHELVILDMVMTGMYGLEVLQKLREMKPETRVIVATADIQMSTAEKVRAAGAKAILNKPIKRQELSDTINVVLAGGHRWN